VKAPIVINDAPYGSERPYNALRVASTLSARTEVELRVFLIGDGVGCAVAGQRLARDSYYLRQRGTIEVKGKGPMTTYLLVGRRDESNAEPTAAAHPQPSAPQLRR
jgi:hypothetical protein